jgi:hypothetical protein
LFEEVYSSNVVQNHIFQLKKLYFFLKCTQVCTFNGKVFWKNIKSRDYSFTLSQLVIHKPHIAGFASITEKTYTISRFLAQMLSVPISPKVPISPNRVGV